MSASQTSPYKSERTHSEECVPCSSNTDWPGSNREVAADCQCATLAGTMTAEWAEKHSVRAVPTGPFLL